MTFLGFVIFLDRSAVKERELVLLTALHFPACLSLLTLLIGESWRVRSALIRRFAILQKPRSDGRIWRRKKKRPPGLRGSLARWSCIISARIHKKADVRGSGPLEDVWPRRAGLDRPSTLEPAPLAPSAPSPD